MLYLCVRYLLLHITSDHYVVSDIILIDCIISACWDVISGCYFFVVCDDMQSKETAVGPIIFAVFCSLMWLELSQNREVVHV